MASIDAIEGIGHKYATKLRKARVRTTEALLKHGAIKRGRKQLAEATGIPERQILEWVNRADLMRIKGVGEEYCCSARSRHPGSTLSRSCDGATRPTCSPQ